MHINNVRVGLWAEVTDGPYRSTTVVCVAVCNGLVLATDLDGNALPEQFDPLWLEPILGDDLFRNKP